MSTWVHFHITVFYLNFQMKVPFLEYCSNANLHELNQTLIVLTLSIIYSVRILAFLKSNFNLTSPITCNRLEIIENLVKKTTIEHSVYIEFFQWLFGGWTWRRTTHGKLSWNAKIPGWVEFQNKFSYYLSSCLFIAIEAELVDVEARTKSNWISKHTRAVGTTATVIGSPPNTWKFALFMRVAL